MYYINPTEAKQPKAKTMNDMTITIDMESGEQAYFKIQFKNKDFIKVVDIVETLTLQNIYNQELFTVI